MPVNWSRGHVQDGSVLRDTDAQRAAKYRRMERTKCPKCGRKGALRDYKPDEYTRVEYCYWRERGLCDYERTIDLRALLEHARARIAARSHER